MSELDYVFPSKPSHKEDESKQGNFLNALFFVGSLAMIFYFFDLSLMFVLGIVIILAMHELGHFIAMKLLKYEDVKLRTVPLLGVAIQGRKSHYSQREKVLVALSGPIPSIIIGVLIITFGNQAWFAIEEINMIILALFLINIMNMLPLDMFDGGKAIEGMFFVQNDRGRFLFTFISSILIILLGLFFKSFIVAGFGFVLGLKVRSIQKLKDIRESLKSINVNYTSSFKGLTNRAYWLIRENIINQSKTLKQIVPSTREEWENEPILIQQVESVLEVPVKKDMNLVGKIMVLLLMIVSISFPIYLILSRNLVEAIDIF